MQSTIFLQSEVADPYKIYAQQLMENPVVWDNVNNLWAVYSYETCEFILKNSFAQISVTDNTGFNEYALAIKSKLTRLSNYPHHETARTAAMILFQTMKPANIQDILNNLIEKEINSNEIDWVNAVCKKLPVLSILKSFQFNADDGNFITGTVEQLVKILQPKQSPENIASINSISKEVYCCVETHILTKAFLKKVLKEIIATVKQTEEEVIRICVSNLIGLLMQSYDAGRGALSNALLHFLLHENLTAVEINNKKYLQKCVTETLRFNPPVHNTRRVAAENIPLNNLTIEKGRQIFIVIAAANRDSQQFENPHQFNAERNNNAALLTFGDGAHSCIAKYFVIDLVTEAIHFLFQKYTTIHLLTEKIEYEPLINLRLPKYILISLS